LPAASALLGSFSLGVGFLSSFVSFSGMILESLLSGLLASLFSSLLSSFFLGVGGVGVRRLWLLGPSALGVAGFGEAG